MVYYFSSVNEGLISASSEGDGYTIDLRWSPAYPSNRSNKVAYHIYMATTEGGVFKEGVKYVSIDGTTTASILDLVPGQLYHFAVRAVEYNPILFNTAQLPVAFGNLVVYPETLLTQNIGITDLIIPVLSVETFPSYGLFQLGYEFFNYLSTDSVNNTFVLTNLSQRGFENTNIRSHQTNGYDGYVTIAPPTVRFTLGREDTNTRIFMCQSRFEFPNYQATITDGYHQVTKDLLTTDLSASDAFNQDFPTYDYAGWHRTNPTDLLTGICVGSYIGGEQYCADGYSGVGRALRGMSLQTQNNQRQEVLLNLTGEPCCLIRRVTSGQTCACYTPGQEYADERCPLCYGSKFVVGYQQFYNPRRSDGRILVRFGAADDDLVMNEAGLESTFTTDCWTLTVPTIKDRDILVRFDEDDNEEFRYEILSVNRNKTLVRLQGVQKFRVQRIRKFDPAYQIRTVRNTEFLPQTISTGLGSTIGIPPHVHNIVINEKTISILQVNQTTGLSQGHNHAVVNGVVQTVLGHTHPIIIPGT